MPWTPNYLIFLVTSELRKLRHSTPCGCLPRKNIQAYSFVTVYCMNEFHNIFCVSPLNYFRLVSCPLHTKSWRHNYMVKMDSLHSQKSQISRILFQWLYVWNALQCTMGHWGMCPSSTSNFNFSGHFRAVQTLTMDSMLLPTQKEHTGL